MSAVTLPVVNVDLTGDENRKSRRFAFCPVPSPARRQKLGNSLPSYYAAGERNADGIEIAA
jgi:hypothetical protein